MVCSAEPAVTEKKFKKRGRPSKINHRVEAVILGRLALGNSLAKICKRPYMPRYSTITAYIDRNEDFKEKYLRARDDQAEYLAEEVQDIADTAIDRDSAAAASVKINARRWRAGTLKSKFRDKTSGDVHVTSVVNNLLVLTAQRQTELQERMRQALPVI